ncbi:hypothetical protein [Paenibacillus phytohabitans]|uniref:hypothetical protein n=1 Tax=Paenibacillus phytohabitans TaxID=2654978 RepID=UPI00300A6D77
MRKFRNKYFYSIITVVLLLGVVMVVNDNKTLTNAESSYNKTDNVTDKVTSTASPKEVVEYHGDLAENFNTVSKLTYGSDAIYEVEVNDSKSFEYEGVIFTVSNANVNEHYKGASIDTVNILETGGNYNNTEYVFEDSSVLKIGDKAIVYLEKYEGPIPEAQGTYVVTGAYQGKFEIDEANGSLIPAAVDQEELKEVRALTDLNLE